LENGTATEYTYNNLNQLTEVLRHRNAIAVMGLVSGVINSTLTALTGGSYSDILISFGVGTLAGMGMAAAYVGTFVIAAMIKAFDAVTVKHERKQLENHKDSGRSLIWIMLQKRQIH